MTVIPAQGKGMGDEAHGQAKEAFFARWRAKLIATAPVIKAEAARAGMLGIGAASIAMLVNDPALFPQVVTGMLGSFIADKLQRWREAEKDDDTQHKLIEADLQTHANHPEVQALFQQLDLASVVTQALADQMDDMSGQLGEVKALLQQMLDAGWATSAPWSSLTTAPATPTQRHCCRRCHRKTPWCCCAVSGQR